VRTNAFDDAVNRLGLEPSLETCVRSGVLVTRPWPPTNPLSRFSSHHDAQQYIRTVGGLQEETHILGTPASQPLEHDRPESVLEADCNLLLPLRSDRFVSDGIAAYLELRRTEETTAKRQALSMAQMSANELWQA